MRYLLALALLASPALAQVPLKDQPIPAAQREAIADHAARRTNSKTDREMCKDIAVKTPIPNPAKIVEWHKMIEAQCMKAKGY